MRSLNKVEFLIATNRSFHSNTLRPIVSRLQDRDGSKERCSTASAEVEEDACANHSAIPHYRACSRCIPSVQYTFQTFIYLLKNLWTDERSLLGDCLRLAHQHFAAPDAQ
ncbi:MAG: hypothetical protein KME30_19735 [Iphinoe sp. HA4291-MV1]|nr:hypothetical protein [Iphinoe sp. HA4291-MV1]